MIAETELTKTAGAGIKSCRVLHVLDHSWPVMSGYSIRSRSLLRAQLQVGLQPQALTGPLHQLDDSTGAETLVDGVFYARTPLASKTVSKAITRHWPVLREAAVVKLLRRRISELVANGSFDVIHAHSPALCGLAAAQVAREKGIPFVYEIRAFWEDAAVDQEKTRQKALRYRMTRRLETHVARRADAVVGIATHILQDLETRGIEPGKLFHISNGVDGDLFQPLARDRQLAQELGLDQEVVLGFAGSLYRYEGISWLVRAVSALRQRGMSCKVLIVGDGEDMPAIKLAIRECRAQDYVMAVGRVPHDQVRRYYSVMDVLVYPRLSNRLTELVTPLKPLEAMALGKAVLGSAVGGIRELVNHSDTGLLFVPGDIDDFCAQAKCLIEQPGLRRELGARARQAVLQEREWKVLARKYEDVYQFALSRNPRARSSAVRARAASDV